MLSLLLHEAQLFNLLTSFFGRDNVIPQMSVLTVCGGGEGIDLLADPKVYRWAKENRCLFTVVNEQDIPKVVIEFFSGFGDSVDLVEEEHQRILPPLLKMAGIRYITFSMKEFDEILTPASGVDFVTLMQAKVDQDEVS